MSREYGYFQDGNTVRKVYEFPDDKRKKINREQDENHRKTYRDTNRDNTMSLGMTMVLVAAVFISLGICMKYLNMQSDISAIKSNISGLRNEIEALSTKNDSVEYEIDSFVDVEYIMKTAKEELGMVSVNENQIVTYKTNRNEYMEQYVDVPEK